MHFFDSAVENWGTSHVADLSLAVLLLILLALVFDFLNGFHDAANSIATIVSTRVLSPLAAVAWAAFWNFIAFIFFSLSVANTMGTGIINPTIVDNRVIAGTLIAACVWDLVTWYWGLPTSSSHALIGGMVGAALAKAVSLSEFQDPLQWVGIGKTVAFIFLAPVVGAITGWIIAWMVTWLCYRTTPLRVDHIFRKGQLLSAAFYSLGHGGNDAQKTMGIIFVLLIAASQGGTAFPTPAEVPTEAVLACHAAMGLGTLFGGWRIVKTMGQRIIRLRPVDGFCAENGAAATLAMTVFGGIPVSTTHTITGSIVGVGVFKRMGSVRWAVAGRVVWAWVLTIPAAALIAAASWEALRLLEAIVFRAG